jgi:hypothetical protein
LQNSQKDAIKGNIKETIYERKTRENKKEYEKAAMNTFGIIDSIGQELSEMDSSKPAATTNTENQSK